MNLIHRFLKPKMKFIKGTRSLSFLFIAVSVMIAAGIIFAANTYYNIDTGEVVSNDIQRVANTLRATGGMIVGGTISQNPSTGYDFEVVGKTKLATTTVASGSLQLTGANQEMRFTGGTNYYIGLKAPTNVTSTKVYILPQHGSNPPSQDYVLTWQPGDQLEWKKVTNTSGAGDITAVGDVGSGDAFTIGGSGSTLWFHPTGNATPTMALVADSSLSADATATLPAVSGTLAVGTGAANQVAYWSGTNTLTGEAQLSTTRGGTGQDTSGWSGMLKVVNGTWDHDNGTAGYVAYWSDANTIGAEQYLDLAKGGTGAGLTANAGGIVYSGSSALAISATGTTSQILTSGGTGAPTWTNIADLVTATNGLTKSGTTNLTLKLGGTLGEDTTIDAGGYNMIFNLTGTAGDFKVQNGGTDIFTVSHDGTIYFKTYPLAVSGKQVLREMIPIFGFDLPAQTASTSYVTVSRTIQGYPFSSPSAGSTRIHKLVIRYADDLPTASSTDWKVDDITNSASSTTFTVPGCNDSSLAAGKTKIITVTVPTNNDSWKLETKIPSAQSGKKIRIFQIFLAAYDQM